jgi:hypothetical protein
MASDIPDTSQRIEYGRVIRINFFKCIYSVPRSRQNPKIRGFDDAEIVGDRIA